MTWAPTHLAVRVRILLSQSKERVNLREHAMQERMWASTYNVTETLE